MKNLLFIILTACIYHITNTAAYDGIPAPMPPYHAPRPNLTPEERAEERRVARDQADARAFELLGGHQGPLGQRQRPGNRVIRRLFD
jgi:hypothetical protein